MKSLEDMKNNLENKSNLKTIPDQKVWTWHTPPGAHADSPDILLEQG